MPADPFHPLQKTLLIVEDNQLSQKLLTDILEYHGYITLKTELGEAALGLAHQHRPDLILMDIGLPGLNGVESTTEILRHCPEVKIVILSMYDDEHSVVGAIRSGARAFVLKKASDNDLIEALRTVAKGGSYLSPQVSDRLLLRIQRGDLDARPMPSALEGLSPRELQVLRLVAEGKTSKEVSALLGISVKTTETHRSNIMRKLNFHSVSQLVMYAVRNNLLRIS